MPFIATSELQRHYRRGPNTVRALDGVDLSVDAGEFLAVVGASGSGKTTLLNLLAGLDSPTAGAVEVDRVALHTRTRRELADYRARKVGIIFQSFNLVPHYSARQNVELALYFNPISRDERRARADSALAELGLSDRAGHRPADLSGGEQQRVAIARALVKDPPLLLADEPTGNLDQENTEQTASLLRAMNERGLTVILVTHDLSLARRLADRIVRMHYGRIDRSEMGDPR